ncbi:MAG: hypothetical protein ACKPBT_17025, partial [Microcystis aeruginosa]
SESHDRDDTFRTRHQSESHDRDDTFRTRHQSESPQSLIHNSHFPTSPLPHFPTSLSVADG